MKDVDVDAGAVMRCLSVMPRRFYTKDLSELPAMLSAHSLSKPDGGYNKAIGRHLSKNATTLGIKKDPSFKGGSNHRWLKLT